MNIKQFSLPLLILLLMPTYLFASIDFETDFNEPPNIAPYEFKGSKDNNSDGKPDEMYYKEGNKELLIEDTDFDGKVNRIGYSENGILIKMEEDIDQDGQWDYRYWYKDGELDRVESSQKSK